MADHDEPSEPRGRRNGEAAGHRRPARVLIVEDEARLQQAYADCLEMAGYESAAASSLWEASLLIVQSELVFDAAVLDLALPDGSGATLVQPLLNRRPLCRAAVITGQTEHGPPLELAKLGAETYVHKPVDPRSLLIAVATTVDATNAWRRAAGQDDASPPATRYHRAATDWIVDAPAAAIDFDIKRAVGRLHELGSLTPAQVLTAARLLWGDSDDDIAKYLGCSLRTARHHVRCVLKGLGVRRRTSLLRVLLEDAGIKDPGALDPTDPRLRH